MKTRKKIKIIIGITALVGLTLIATFVCVWHRELIDAVVIRYAISKSQQRIRTLEKKKSDAVNTINTEIEQLNNNLNKLKVQLIRFNQDKE